MSADRDRADCTRMGRAVEIKSQRVRVAIVTTHSIQYYAPVFRALSECDELEVRVFYSNGGNSERALSRPLVGSWPFDLMTTLESVEPRQGSRRAEPIVPSKSPGRWDREPWTLDSTQVVPTSCDRIAIHLRVIRELLPQEGRGKVRWKPFMDSDVGASGPTLTPVEAEG